MIVLANTLSAIALVLGSLLNIYFWIVIIAAVLTWVRPDPYNPIVRTLRSFTGCANGCPSPIRAAWISRRWWCCWLSS